MKKHLLISCLLFLCACFAHAQEKKDSISNKMSIDIAVGANSTYPFVSPYFTISHASGIGITNYLGKKRKRALYSAFYYDNFNQDGVYLGVSYLEYFRFMGINETLLIKFIDRKKTNHSCGFGILIYALVETNRRSLDQQIVAFLEVCYNFQYKINDKFSISLSPNLKYTIKYLEHKYRYAEYQYNLMTNKYVETGYYTDAVYRMPLASFGAVLKLNYFIK